MPRHRGFALAARVQNPPHLCGFCGSCHHSTCSCQREDQRAGLLPSGLLPDYWWNLTCRGVWEIVCQLPAPAGQSTEGARRHQVNDTCAVATPTGQGYCAHHNHVGEIRCEKQFYKRKERKVHISQESWEGRVADKTTTLNRGVSVCQKAEFPLWDQLRLCLEGGVQVPYLPPIVPRRPGQS